MGFSIEDIYREIYKLWRAKRFSLFIKSFSPSQSDRLLDVGGNPSFWISQPPLVGSITSLNLDLVVWESQKFPQYNLKVIRGDGCHLFMPDKSYDIAFSNSVIEHVGDWERQCAFAEEIRRVGNGVWVQTPARECPIEPHYLAPFVHWLPKSFQKRTLRYFTLRGLMERPTQQEIKEMVETTRLLTFEEMKILFPDCQIYIEPLIGFIPKSYVAIRKRTEL